MNYKIAICDDEPQHITKIRNILYDHETDNYTEPEMLLKAISGGKRYDVLFLDILMPNLDGISLARELREYDKDMLIIFITSNLNFMQTGYEVRAFRYILKDQLSQSLPKVWQDIQKELMQHQDAYFTYEFERKMHRVPLQDILYLESNLRRVILHMTSGQEAVLYAKLDDLTEKCPTFIRIHKSYLVNLQYIRTISAETVILSNGDMLPISRRYASNLERFV